MVSLILQQTAAALRAVDDDGCTPLHHCATNRQTLVTDLLVSRWLQTGCDAVNTLLEMTDCHGLTTLAHAVIAGNQTLVEHLLALGADVGCHDNQRRTVMHFATGQHSMFRPRVQYVNIIEHHLRLLFL